MLKGHVQIELHNHKTGLRDRIEQDNLVTNAVPLIANALAGRGKSMDLLMPLATKAYGGLMIFEDPLTESVDNVCIPGNSILTAFAGQTLNTADPLMGSINQSESGPTENGYEHVWEFNTSQANGLVSSLSLTNSTIVNFTIPHLAFLTDIVATSGSFYSRSLISPSGSLAITGPNESFRLNNNMYYSTSSGSTLSKNELRAQTSDYTIMEAINTTNPSTVIRTVTQSLSEDDTDYTRLKSYCFYGSDGYVYYIPEVSSGSSITIYRAPIETTDPCEWSSKTITDCTTISSAPRNNVTGYLNAVSNGKFFKYVRFAGESLQYIIDDYATASETSYSLSDTPLGFDTPLYYMAPLKGGGVLCFFVSTTGGNYKTIAQINGDGDFKIYRNNQNLQNVVWPLMWNDDGTVVKYDNNRTLSIPASYLGTIANLEHPFEKTNTVSMKVKYRLTQV